MFRAILLEKTDDAFSATLRELSDADLQTHAAAGDVVVDVAHSTINYKDGLALTGKGPVVRRFPMIPGIDLAGEVTACASGMRPSGSPTKCTASLAASATWSARGSALPMSSAAKITMRRATNIGSSPASSIRTSQ